MTENANILTTPSVTPSRHQVIALAYDGLCTFEFGVAVEIFGLPRPEMGDNWYQFAVAAVDEGPLCATGGIRLMTDGGPELLARRIRSWSPAGAASTPRSPRRCAPRWLPPTPADVGLFLSVPGCSFSPPPGCSMAARRQPTGATPRRCSPVFRRSGGGGRPLRGRCFADDFRRQRGGDRPLSASGA